MTDHDVRLASSEVAEPPADPAPRWIWDDEGFAATPFSLGVLAVALLATGSGVLVLGHAVVSSLLSR